MWASQVALVVKNPPSNAGDVGSIPGPVIKIPHAGPPKIRESMNHNNTNLTLRNPLNLKSTFKKKMGEE